MRDVHVQLILHLLCAANARYQDYDWCIRQKANSTIFDGLSERGCHQQHRENCVLGPVVISKARSCQGQNEWEWNRQMRHRMNWCHETGANSRLIWLVIESVWCTGTTKAKVKKYYASWPILLNTRKYRHKALNAGLLFSLSISLLKTTVYGFVCARASV